ncbi:MAG: response regulator transcription factor [Lachnospiraceae bacterium]|nr:response regulator transcription factor [Lachnospiraceae bacterium]
MINIAICDDEKKDIIQLKSILQEVLGKYSVSYDIQEYESGESLMQAASLFHLIFLDIVMNDENGIDIGKHIHRKNRATKIIFQTNFGQYCQEAINRTHAFAFLEKPLKTPAVEAQIKEFFEDSEGTQDLMMDFHNVRYSHDGTDVVKSIVSIPVKEIVYFEYIKMQKEIKIVTKSTEYIYSETMNRLEEKMQPLGFEMCCRGILVNLERVTRIKMYNVLLDTGGNVPLSQRRVKEFKERINEYLHDSFH